MATKVLNINGIPFHGFKLKISCPSKYIGPVFQHQTWQELTGKVLPYHTILDSSPDERRKRELFLGNTTPEMTNSMLQDFLGDAMVKVGLNVLPGRPVLACFIHGKFAFIELRMPQEADNALNLNNIPFLGVDLCVQRPSSWTGPAVEHGNWENIVANHL